MKIKQLRFMGYCLTIGLIVVLTMVMTSCSPTSTSAPTTTSTATLSSIAVTPATPDNLAMGSTQQFTATGTYSDGSTVDISSQTTWTSSDNTIATISSLGLVTSVATGSTSVTAALSGITSPVVTLTVVPAPVLSSIAVTPSTPDNLVVGLTEQFAASGTFADGSIVDVTSQVTWASDTRSTATIDSAGLATGIAVGNTNITATLSGITSPAVSLLVVASTLSSIAVTPSTPNNLAVGLTEQFAASGTYSDDSTADITGKVTWASSDTSIVTISSSGLAIGIAPGNSNITATLSGITSPSVILPVTTLTGLAITPASPDNLVVGSSQLFKAVGTLSNGIISLITSPVTWASSDSTIATISSSGLATGVAAGTANITATVSGITSPPVSLIVTATISTTTSP